MNWLRVALSARKVLAAIKGCVALRIPILFVHGVNVVVNGAQVHFT